MKVTVEIPDEAITLEAQRFVAGACAGGVTGHTSGPLRAAIQGATARQIVSPEVQTLIDESVRNAILALTQAVVQVVVEEEIAKMVRAATRRQMKQTSAELFGRTE